MRKLGLVVITVQQTVAQLKEQFGALCKGCCWLNDWLPQEFASHCAPEPPKGPAQQTVAQLKEQLAALGLATPKNARKPALVAQLQVGPLCVDGQLQMVVCVCVRRQGAARLALACLGAGPARPGILAWHAHASHAPLCAGCAGLAAPEGPPQPYCA